MTAKKKKKIEEEEIVDLTGIEQVVQKNRNVILGVLAGLVLLAALTLLLKKNKESGNEKASVAAFDAQQKYDAGEWASAVDGGEDFMGFAEIAKKYKSSALGNLAHYYSGTSYIKLGDNEKALEHFKKFKATKDPNINALAFGNTADLQMEAGDESGAIKNYKMAAESGSELFQANYMLTYARALIEVSGDDKKALAVLKDLINKFPLSTEATSAESYIAGLE